MHWDTSTPHGRKEIIFCVNKNLISIWSKISKEKKGWFAIQNMAIKANYDDFVLSAYLGAT